MTRKLKCVDIRESMKFLPKHIQPFLTWLTAKPLNQDSYPSNQTALYHVLTACISVLAGVTSSILLLNFKGPHYIFIIFSQILTVSGLRKLQVVIYHHCAHNNIFSNKRANYVLGELISIILLIKDFRTYRHDHMIHHSAKGLLTHRDETVQDLSSVGLIPGLGKKTLYRNMLFSFVSPFSQLRSLLNRISSSLLSPYWQHNVIAIIYWVLLIFVINYFQWKMKFCIVWVIPLTVLYHISRTLRLIVEHTWPKDVYLDNRGLDFVSASTIAVFLGETFPNRTNHKLKNMLAYSSWVLKMLSIHLFARVFVLVGDTPCHDYHHRNPSSKNWMNYTHARHKDSKKSNFSSKIPYQEIWGFFKAIDINFEAMSKSRQTNNIRQYYV